MSTNPEPVPGPGIESAGWRWKLAGSLAGAHTLVGDTGFQKNSDESRFGHQERLHRSKRDEGKGIESQWEIVKGEEGKNTPKTTYNVIPAQRVAGNSEGATCRRRSRDERQGWWAAVQTGGGGDPESLAMGTWLPLQTTQAAREGWFQWGITGQGSRDPQGRMGHCREIRQILG